jgi:purine-binding chemotaxis protein CheW
MGNSCEVIEQPALLATFYVRNSLYALEAAVVQEVVRLSALTPVHYAPPEVAGVINLRGRIVTVLDIGLKLGLPAIAPGKEARVFIIDQRDESIGLLTDRVGEVVETDGTNIDPLPANIPAHQSRFFKGVCRTQGRVITWLDASAF